MTEEQESCPSGIMDFVFTYADLLKTVFCIEHWDLSFTFSADIGDNRMARVSMQMNYNVANIEICTKCSPVEFVKVMIHEFWHISTVEYEWMIQKLMETLSPEVKKHWLLMFEHIQEQTTERLTQTYFRIINNHDKLPLIWDVNSKDEI